MQDNLGSGRFIFVASQNDLFAEGVPIDFIHKTLSHCKKFDNTYLFQSKNPDRFCEFSFKDFPAKTRLCTTIETNRFIYDIDPNCSNPKSRGGAMGFLSNVFDVYVTIEPIMEFDLDKMTELIRNCGPVQVAIGADSGNNHLPEPSKEKVLALIERLSMFTKVVQKDNLKRLLK
jgi:hypothetical protein